MMTSISADSLNLGTSTAAFSGKVSVSSEAEDANSASNTEKTGKTQTTADSSKTLASLGNTSAIDEISENGDTVSLSTEGLNLSQSEGTASTASSSSEATANNNAASGTSASSAASNSLTEDTTDDLSSYTLAQLQTMLNNGEITQAEYNAEIASRDESSFADSSSEAVSDHLTIDLSASAITE